MSAPSPGAASGEDMGVAAKRNPVRMAIAAWEWGNYYGDAKIKGAKLDIAKWKRPSPETIPTAAKAAGLYMICTMSKHAAEAKGCSDAICSWTTAAMSPRRPAPTSSSSRTARCTPRWPTAS